MPPEGTMDMDVLLQTTGYVPLVSISSGDCEYQFSYNIKYFHLNGIHISDYNVKLSAIQPKFNIEELGSGGSDYSKVSLNEPGQIVVDATEQNTYE